MTGAPFTLIIESGAAQTRAALMRDGKAYKFFFAPARGDEGRPRSAEAGDIYCCRIGKKISGGVFVNLGEAVDGFLPLKPSQTTPQEGALEIMRIRRSALGHKGAVIALNWKQGLTAKEIDQIQTAYEQTNAPGRLSYDIDPVFLILRRAWSWIGATHAGSGGAGIEKILLKQARDQQIVRAFYQKADAPIITIAANAFEEEGATQALEEALERLHPLPGGARLVIDETEGGAIIDVDAGAASPKKVNEAAGDEVGRILALRDIGGRIVVDFLPMADGRVRASLLERIKQGCAPLPGARLGKMAPDGFLDITAPRIGPSLLQRASEPAAGPNWLRPGRRLRAEWASKAAIDLLEHALTRAPTARLVLRLSDDLYKFVQMREEWPARLKERYGARFSIERSDDLKEGSYDVIS